MAKSSWSRFSALHGAVLLKLIYCSGCFDQPDWSGLDWPLADLSAAVTLGQQHSDEASDLWERLDKKLWWVWRGCVRAKHPRRIPDRKCGEWIREATSVCTITPLTSSFLGGEETFSHKRTTRSQVHRLTAFAQQLKSVAQIAALSGETRWVKGLQSLGEDTFKRPSLVR